MATLACFNPFSGVKMNFKRGKRISPAPKEHCRIPSSRSTILSNDEFIPAITIDRQHAPDPNFDRFPAEIGGDLTRLPSYSEIVAAFFEPPPSYQQAILSSVPDENVSQVRTEAWVRASGDLITRRTNDCPVVADRSRTHRGDTDSSTPTVHANTNDVRMNNSPAAIRPDAINTASINPASVSPTSISPSTRRRIRQSWTHCLQWIVQYSIECNFRSTIAHFLSMITQALRIKKEHGTNCVRYPISTETLAVPLPSTFSRRMWKDLIFAFGFSTVTKNLTNSSSTTDFIVVPRTVSSDEITRYKNVLNSLIELPYYTVKTAANLSPQETENMVALLSYTLSTQNSLLPLDHTLVKPVWDAHKRPWLLLQSLNYSAEKSKRDINKSHRPESLLRLPVIEVERYRVQLTRRILAAFTEEYTQGL